MSQTVWIADLARLQRVVGLCSASILILHREWRPTEFFESIRSYALQQRLTEEQEATVERLYADLRQRRMTSEHIGSADQNARGVARARQHHRRKSAAKLLELSFLQRGDEP